MFLQIKESRARLKRRKIAWTATAERKLTRQLVGLFDGAFNETLGRLQQAGRVPSGAAAQRQIIQAIEAKHGAFTQTIQDAAVEAAEHGRKEVFGYADTVPHAPRFDHTSFSEPIRDRIRDHAFTASDRTMDRVRGDVMGNLQQSYADGLGIDEASERLRGSFDNMKDYELKRVARTEINSFQNEGAHETCKELSDYEQWWGADDLRSRGTEPEDMSDHTGAGLHGEIVRTGDQFSNGLYYPGDRSGGEATIHEWINCRCRVVPFFMPPGYKAPDKTQFREGDLVKDEPEQEPGEKELQDFCRENEVDPEVFRDNLGANEARSLMLAMDDHVIANKGTLNALRSGMGGKLSNFKGVKRGMGTEWTEMTRGSYSAAFPEKQLADIAREVTAEWAGASNSRGALAMQKALQQTGLSKGKYTNKVYAKVMGKRPRDIDAMADQYLAWNHGITAGKEKIMREVVLRDYVRTQKLLKAMGVPKKVDVVRGIRGSGVPDTGSWTYYPRAAESFSTQTQTAKSFGEVLLKTKVDRRRIFAHDATNTTFWEDEAVFLWHKNYVRPKIDPSLSSADQKTAVFKKREPRMLSDLSWDIYVAARHARRIELGRDLTEEQIEAVAQEVGERLDQVEVKDHLALLEEYSGVVTE